VPAKKFPQISRSWQLFGLIGVLWGIPYLFIRIAVEQPGGFEPGFLVFARTLLGALILLPLALRKKVLTPALKRFKWVFLYAIMELAGPWYFLSSGERHVTSGLAGLLIATVPFWSSILASFLGDKTVWHKHRLGGMVVGFIGVVFVVGTEAFRGENQPFSIFIILVGSIGYAIAPMMIRRKAPELDGLAINSVAMAIVATIYIPVGIIQWPTEHVNAKAIWSLIILATLCTAAAFIVFFKVIVDLGPTRASMVTYLNTVIAVILGIIILSEPLTIGMIIGMPLVLVGSYFAGKKN
jgi:drug/metabolite transporter (DMT)-like permease